MSDTKQRRPLLQDALTAPERMALGQVTHHGGFRVLDKLYEAILLLATADMVKLDPEENGYERLLAIRSQRSRNFNECIKMIRDSIDYHLDAVKIQDAEENKEAVDAVGKVFGIHPARPVTKDKIRP